MNIQPISFKADFTKTQIKNSEDFPDNRIESVSRRQYKTTCVTGDFIAGGLTGYAIMNVIRTNIALKRIGELPKEDIIKNVGKIFKSNIKWGFLTGIISAVAGYFWFDYTEGWQKKMMTKTEILDAQSKVLKTQTKAKKELQMAIKTGDKEAQDIALDNLNKATEKEKAIKDACLGHSEKNNTEKSLKEKTEIINSQEKTLEETDEENITENK